jgi:SPP1 gp7 family putative phage head morphogenesis protein
VGRHNQVCGLPGAPTDTPCREASGWTAEVFKTAERRATLVARTETLRAHNEGRKSFYRQVGITKVRWLTAHDERTCKIGWPLDGQVFGSDEVERPPAHRGCRC